MLLESINRGNTVLSFHPQEKLFAMQHKDRHQKHFFDHILVKNDHLIVIEGFLEPYG